MPVHVLWGEADRVLPARHAEGLPPSVAVTRIAGAGHIPQMERAAEVNAILAEISE
jgi:pyruvate dehydrogenase E2 component (dihydrolipoamide acetyltransferase)